MKSESAKENPRDLKASEKLLQQIDQLDQPQEEESKIRRRHKDRFRLVSMLEKACRITNYTKLFAKNPVWAAQVEG